MDFGTRLEKISNGTVIGRRATRSLNNKSGYNFDDQQMDPAMKPEIYGDVSIAVGAKP